MEFRSSLSTLLPGIVTLALLVPLLWLFPRFSRSRVVQSNPRRTTAAAEAPTNASRDDRLKTFRVCDIPGDHDERDTLDLLQRVLELDDSHGLYIRSLAVNARKPHTKVATIDFQSIPSALSPSPSTRFVSRDFEIVSDTDRGASKPGYLHVDNDFFGLTTLASPPPETHIVEYGVPTVP